MRLFQNLQGSFKRNRHQHPLLQACQAGDLPRLRLLVQKHSRDVDVVEEETLRTGLHIAAELGYDGIVGELLDRQACSSLVDSGGRTALHYAAAHGHTKCVQLLVGPRNRDPQKQAQLNVPTSLGYTPLLVAAMGGHVGVMEVLLRAGANMHDALENRVTAGHLAARGGHTHALACLQSHGFNLSIDTLQRDTLLHEAAAHGHARTAAFLMAAGLSPNAQNFDGKSPIDVARGEGHQGTLAVLKGAAPGAAAGAAGALPGAAATAPAAGILHRPGAAGAEPNEAVPGGVAFGGAGVMNGPGFAGGMAGAGSMSSSGRLGSGVQQQQQQQQQQQAGGEMGALQQLVVHPDREVYSNYPTLVDDRPPEAGTA